MPGGTSTCAKPGTGAGECGAGIPAGTKLTFNVLYANHPAIIGEMLTDWASEAKKVGISVALQGGTFNHVIDVADDPGSPKTINDWAMADYGGFTDATYPTTFGIFNTGGSYNGGFYNNAEANKLINASVTGGNPDAVKAEASYLTAAAAQPVPAQPRLHHRLEGQRLRPAGRDQGHDPVLPEHGADVPDEVRRRSRLQGGPDRDGVSGWGAEVAEGRCDGLPDPPRGHGDRGAASGVSVLHLPDAARDLPHARHRRARPARQQVLDRAVEPPARLR